MACGAPIAPEDARKVFGPEDTSSILRLLPFAVTCPSCGREQHIGHTCLWADSETGTAVRLTVPGETPVQFEPSQAGMALRDTDDMLVFREKILLCTAGYDDRIVEMIKLLSTGEKGEEDLTFIEIMAVDAGVDGILMSGLRADGSSISFVTPRALYENVQREIPTDVLASDGFVTVDGAWARRRVAPRQEK